jgi:DNA-binding NarL/FixJ family response regulator
VLVVTHSAYNVQFVSRGLQSMPLTILVVDDDLGTRLSISDYLELSGYSVITADDGEQALTMVEHNHPDLIVTDIVMPRMNGYELVRRVRQQPMFRLLPVILLTARTKTQERILGYQSGCDLYLPKPFELEELAAAIRNLLERSQIIQSEYRLSHNDDLYSQSNHTPTEKPQLFEPLSKREQEVLRFISEGLSNVEMGDKLHLSPRTIEKYVSSLFRKTATNNRAQLVRFAIKYGLVE